MSTKKKQGKVRVNISISPDTLEIAQNMAEEMDTTLSGLITRWILEKRVSAPTPMITALKPPKINGGQKAK